MAGKAKPGREKKKLPKAGKSKRNKRAMKPGRDVPGY